MAEEERRPRGAPRNHPGEPELREAVRRMLALSPATRDTLTFEPMHGGRSGAATFGLDADGAKLVLRLSPEAASESAFTRHVEAQRAAAEAGLAPPVVGVDEAQRWTISERIDGVPLPQALGSPGTAPALLERLGATLGALHEVAVPEIVLRTSGAALDLVRHLRAATEARGALPETARLVLDEVELEAPPEPERVLCHRDLNPTNVVWTGERFVLLDWETAGAGDGRIDLATVVNWLLLDDARTSSVLAAYARARGQPEIEPGALRPARRLAHAAYAISLLSLVERPLGEIAEDEPPTLARCYEELATGALDMQSDAGRGRLASALLGEYQRL